MTNTTMQHNGQVSIVTGSETFGTSYVAVLVKRSFKIVPGNAAERLEKDSPFRLNDEYYDDGDPTDVSVKHEAEATPKKLGTDVVVVGSAYAPRTVPCYEMQAAISVGNRTKTLAVIGDRWCEHLHNAAPRFSQPLPFLSMPIRYELAYGGRDLASIPNCPVWYPRNDRGTGFALSNDRRIVDKLRLPNIEDPNDRLTPERLVVGAPERWHEQPLPQGFGWRHPSSFPRCAQIGACPPFLEVGTVTKEEQMGLLPPGYVALARQFRLKPDPVRFSSGASLGLTIDNLVMGEAVKLVGLSPLGDLEFHLPNETPVIALELGKGLEQLVSQIYTVSIRPDDLELDIIWGGTRPIGDFRNWANVSRLIAEVR